MKTDGTPWGSGSAKTLRREIFRSTVFCYYAGKLLLHTIPVTVVVFDIQNRSLKAWSCTTEVKGRLSGADAAANRNYPVRMQTGRKHHTTKSLILNPCHCTSNLFMTAQRRHKRKKQGVSSEEHRFLFL